MLLFRYYSHRSIGYLSLGVVVDSIEIQLRCEKRWWYNERKLLFHPMIEIEKIKRNEIRHDTQNKIDFALKNVQQFAVRYIKIPKSCSEKNGIYGIHCLNSAHGIRPLRDLFGLVTNYQTLLRNTNQIDSTEMQYYHLFDASNNFDIYLAT